MTIKNILSVVVVCCSISLSCFGDAKDDVKNVVLSTSLSPQERAMQVAALIEQVGAEGGDVTELTQIALQNASPDEVGFMMVAILFKNSSDDNVATAVSTVMAQHPAQAAEILASVMTIQDSGTASKVMATVALVAPTAEAAQAVMAQVERVVTEPAKVAALQAAASNPASVVNVVTVQTTGNNVAAGRPPAVTVPGTQQPEEQAPEVGTAPTPPAIPPEVVDGYGRQTS